MTRSTALFVMPRSSDAWGGAAALWITAAGWAAAADRLVGRGVVITPDSVASAAQVLDWTGRAVAASRSAPAKALPEGLKVAAKDVRQWHQQKRYRRSIDATRWSDAKVPFVWQHHDLFHRAGESLARRLEVPLVAYVHAPQVWEARCWGVKRPLTGAILERIGEAPSLRASDLVACVSEEVADQLVRLGVREDRVLVAPMSVDPERFTPAASGADVRERYGLGDAVVIGWTGSFRRFHGLDRLLDSVAALGDAGVRAHLLLVGDGQERGLLEAHAQDLGIADRVVFTGAVPHEQIPSFLAAMDAAAVTADRAEAFHYSPLKLREYLACGLPVVAPAAGEMGRDFVSGRELLVYEPDRPGALADALLALLGDPELAKRLGNGGRELVVAKYSWDRQLQKVLDALGLPAGEDL